MGRRHILVTIYTIKPQLGSCGVAAQTVDKSYVESI